MQKRAYSEEISACVNALLQANCSSSMSYCVNWLTVWPIAERQAARAPPSSPLPPSFPHSTLPALQLSPSPGPPLPLPSRAHPAPRAAPARAVCPRGWVSRARRPSVCMRSGRPGLNLVLASEHEPTNSRHGPISPIADRVCGTRARTRAPADRSRPLHPSNRTAEREVKMHSAMACD